MKYISTRGKAPALRFEDVAVAGLAPDGGLYVPQKYPRFSTQQIHAMKGQSYQELVFTVISPFVDGAIAEDELKAIIKESYAEFRDKQVAPLQTLGENEYVLELFHGPTMAFKDFALQFLGRVFEHVLSKRNEYVTIVGATSGDTGSAAIEGCRHCKHVNMFILHPHGRISEVQRRQMTTVLADNVHNLAIEGTFDDCQDLVKTLFSDQSFLGGKNRMTAINSINWCRIMAQIVYYFYAAVKLGAPEKPVSFSVPTGNFGDIFAGYIAKKMGLPIAQLVIATNTNDILHRFIADNDYSRGELVQTLSPSMDIQIASNFERLLFDLYDNDGAKVAALMNGFREHGLSVGDEQLAKARAIFSSFSVNDDLICKTIKQVFDQTGMAIDPHTATGVAAARHCNKDKKVPMVVLSTAHTAKFPAAIEKAGLPTPQLPESFAGLMEREERCEVLANDLPTLQRFIVAHS